MSCRTCPAAHRTDGRPVPPRAGRCPSYAGRYAGNALLEPVLWLNVYLGAISAPKYTLKALCPDRSQCRVQAIWGKAGEDPGVT